MPLRPPAGFIRPGYDPLKVPDAPTIGTATGGDASASVAFTAPSNVGGSAISQYTAVSTPGQFFAQGSASPLTVTGLSNGTSYTFAVWALNTYGPSPYSAASGSVTPVAIRGLFAGGTPSNQANVTNTIDYITIATTGNASSFGELNNRLYYGMSASSSSRGLFMGGITNTGSTLNNIDYVTIASTGNASDFGDLSSAWYTAAALSNATRALVGGGDQNGTQTNAIVYVTIATLGNSTSFGTLSTASRNSPAGCASTTRGLFAGGFIFSGSATYYNVIDYVEIATTGNATDFGDLTLARNSLAALSSNTRGVFCGGNSEGGASNVMDYVTIASAGNATDFGDLSGTNYNLSATSSSTRGVIAGGISGGAATNVIQYITIANTGNTTDFGDLTADRNALAACSNGHGGL